jgi:hypothetical protein
MTGHTGFVSPLLVVPETLLSILPVKQVGCSVTVGNSQRKSSCFQKIPKGMSALEKGEFLLL